MTFTKDGIKYISKNGKVCAVRKTAEKNVFQMYDIRESYTVDEAILNLEQIIAVITKDLFREDVKK
jgi:hypothetical protein